MTRDEADHGVEIEDAVADLKAKATASIKAEAARFA